GSAQLDARGLTDKARLVDYLANQPAGSEVLIVGFTDSVGEFDSNLNLSRQRAGQVAEEIADFAGSRLAKVAISSIGFGEIAPVNCNEEEDGRRINRRVEVWVKSPT
ncbi:MAG: OmpA family protein, partial [Yoonia sp.]|uniref:OmpA family protein n=1 Tax=Yoonia sp. TaxID=2212373 RepID=UPI00273F84E7